DRVRVLSVGAGRCEMELSLAKNLLDRGMRNFSFACMDLNGRMLRTATAQAAKLGVESKFTFIERDIAKFKTVDKYDVVIANQCLHHFTALEAAFDSIQVSLREGGSFITSDVIGRNGHQLWPEAVEEVLQLWRTLPSRCKYDRTLGRPSENYVNYNHANVGFEGIRAEDILRLLVERFEFEVFAPHACIILPFVERRFGWNFNADEQSDRDFIDRVAMRDETLLAAGKLKPTQLLARMTNTPVRDYVSTCAFSPRDCIRWPD
ncbi:MAG: class I SAM-dependent methyltransferase, partial [Rudaea sp.]